MMADVNSPPLMYPIIATHIRIFRTARQQPGKAQYNDSQTAAIHDRSLLTSVPMFIRARGREKVSS